MKVDVVLECTGLFTTKERAGAHLKGGARKVIISAPGGKDVDATIVFGVNHKTLKPGHRHLQRILHDQLPCAAGQAAARQDRRGIRVDDNHPFLHQRPGAYGRLSRRPAPRSVGDHVHDSYQDRGRRRGGPGAPELNGKLDGYAIRVPTINVSVVDLSFIAARDTSIEEVDAILKEASEGDLKGILDFNTEPLVSVDFNHNPASSTYDSTLTKVSGRLVKVSSWYDNEWGFSNRMLDTTVALVAAK
jgi:glyceraldehyde 3-phosphate dehydrogenase